MQKYGELEMINLKAYLEKRIKEIISDWNDTEIYAISFLVYANEANEYNGYSNVPCFFVGYNTERDCGGAGALSEERWNFAFWRQDLTPVIDAVEEDEGMQMLFDWYREKQIENIGYEDHTSCYDEKMRYIGKGPNGYYPLLMEISAIAKDLQESGFIREKFGTSIPIIIQDFEYAWYIFEANRIANPHGEADVFFSAMKKKGCMGI